MDLSDPPAAGLDDGSTTVADEERPPPVELEPSPASPGDPPASPADDQSSGSSSAWTSTVEGSDELSPVAATRNSEQSPDLSDSDAADDELELTNDGSASPGSAERDNEMEWLAHLFDQTLFAGGAERDLNRYLAMLAYELERDTHNDKVKPAPECFRSAVVQVADFNLRRAEILAASEAGQRRLRILQLHSHKHHSTKAMHELERVELKSLILRKAHHVNYLLFRTVTLPVLLSGLLLVCQDPSGTACKVELHGLPYNFNTSAGELDALFPKGSVIAIKAPRLRDDARGDLSVQCYSPTDFDLLPTADAGLVWHDSALVDADPLPKRTIKTWKKIGKGYVEKGWHHAAERAFTLGLRLGEHASLRLARSSVRSDLGLKRAALDDAEAVLALDQSSYSTELLQSAHLRSAVAADDLQLWELAQERLEQVRALCPTSPEHIEDFLDSLAARRRSAETGEYDWPTLLEASLIEPGLHVAEYVHPRLLVEATKEGGRRVVAGADIKAGQLLALVTPIASCLLSESPDDVSIRTLNFGTRSLDDATSAGLVHRLFAQSADNPTIARTIDRLYAGVNFACEPAGYPLASLAAGGQANDDVLNSAINPARIEAVQTRGAFQIDPSVQMSQAWTTLRYTTTLVDLISGDEITISPCWGHDLPNIGSHWAETAPEVEVARDPLAWQELYDSQLQAIKEFSQRTILPVHIGWHPRPELCLAYEDLAYIAFIFACDGPDMETRSDWAQVATDCGRAALDSIGALHGNTGEIGDDEIEPTAPCALAGVAIRVCLLLAGTWKAVGEEARKENWLRAASSLHTVTFGGGQPMLARIFEHHLRTAGLNADELF